MGIPEREFFIPAPSPRRNPGPSGYLNDLWAPAFAGVTTGMTFFHQGDETFFLLTRREIW